MLSTQSVAKWRSYQRLIPYLKPYLGSLLIVLAISLLSTAFGLAQPYFSKLMIDNALLKGDFEALAWIAALMVITAIFGYGLNILSSYRYIATSASILFDIRAALLRHLQTLSPRFYSGFRLGDLMSRLNSDVSTVQRAATDSLLSVLSNLLFLIGCTAMMLWMNWRLFLISAMVIPACIAVFLHYQRKLTALTSEMREHSAGLGSLLVDTVIGMRVVTSLRAGEYEVNRFNKKNDAFIAVMLRIQIASFMTTAIPSTMTTISTAAVILYGGWLIFGGQMTIGTLVAFMAYQMRLFSPIQVLMGMTSNLASARVSLARIFELFDTRADVLEKPRPLPLGPVRTSVRFEGVAISHGGRQVLAGVDFEIGAGAFCAILGASGAGKSTIADLLVRYLDPDKGRILVDCQDLRDVALADLRRQVVLVDQSPHLFNDTIAANIAFAMPGATPWDIEAAVRTAGLDALIRRLPEGLSTRTGERGLALSVGERQRIALARALLRRPSLLILDEPTSALDSDTERLIAQGLRGALPDATIIVITHKPALAEMANQVITLDQGCTSVESGSP